MNPSTELQAIVKAGNVVTIKKGDCNINGAIGIQDDDLDITLENASSQPRIDRIVLRLDDNVSARNISIQVLAGTPSANPTPPPLTRITSVHDLCIASIYRPANATAIKQSDITDTRADVNLCGIVCGTIKEADSQTLFLQIQACLKEFKENEEAEFVIWSDGRKLTFDEWFETIKGKLGEDIAGSLQMQIDDLGKSKLPITYQPSWGEVTGKPVDFPPTSHKHDFNSISNKPTAYPPATHSHQYSTLTGLPTSFPPSSHTHAEYKLKGDFAIVTGSIPAQSGSFDASYGYPSGFNSSNCIVVSYMAIQSATGTGYSTGNNNDSSMSMLLGVSSYLITLRSDAIRLQVRPINTSGASLESANFKIVLMKV